MTETKPEKIKIQKFYVEVEKIPQESVDGWTSFAPGKMQAHMDLVVYGKPITIDITEESWKKVMELIMNLSDEEQNEFT